MFLMTGKLFFLFFYNILLQVKAKGQGLMKRGNINFFRFGKYPFLYKHMF